MDLSAVAVVEDGNIVIRLPIKNLPVAVEGSIALGTLDGPFKVTDAEKFAKDVVTALDELSYECGFLRGGMKHVEEKLERLRGKHYAVDVLSVLLADMITALRNTREKASDEARTYAKERWIDRRIDQEKMDAADDMAE